MKSLLQPSFDVVSILKRIVLKVSKNWKSLEFEKNRIIEVVAGDYREQPSHTMGDGLKRCL